MSMYHQHFDLQRSPFSIAPDPHFLYMSERHREALAHLEWGLSGAGGFVLLTGEVGTGKTTLCRCLLEKIPDDTEVAFVINPRVTVTELLTTICEELGDAPPEGEQHSVKRLVDRINGHLLAAHGRGGRVVLVIDEAQNLAVDVLEQVRLLTNLETNERKLLQVILLGQPELAAMLEAPELRQLAQRVTARYHLLPLSVQELSALVHHRLAVAGARRNPFSADALTALHRRSGGIPRLANVIADRALLGAYAEGAAEVDARIVRRAAQEVLGAGTTSPAWRRRPVALGIAAVAAMVLLGLTFAAVGGRFPAADDRVASAADGATPGASGTAPAPAPAAVPGPARPDASQLTAAGRSDADDPGNAESGGDADGDDGTAVETRAAPAPSPDAERPAAPQGAAPSTSAAPDPLGALWQASPEATRLEAVGALLDAWYAPIPLEAGADPCTQVGAAGLRCLTEQGSWPGLFALDRPAVLELWRAGRDRPRHLALLGSDAGSVTVFLDGERRRLPRAEIDRDWRGHALVLWQMPPGYGRPSSRGDDDATSTWLAERLALLDGESAANGRFDAALEARVRSFQLAAGLRPDGIVGPRTWMRLNDATGVGTPRLREP